MDAIDANLLEAWNRLDRRLRDDRIAAARRARRGFGEVLRRPLRPWCLVIRANDRRINEFTAAIVSAEGPNPIENGYTHDLELSGELIRRLCKPVDIPWPGVDWTIAAARLGRHPVTMRTWIDRGILQAMFVNSRSLGKRGPDVPVVWSPSPLDPNSHFGRPPDPVWGTLWQTLWRRLPEEYGLLVRREPRRVNYQGRMRQRGWRFRCPGRFFPLPAVGAASIPDGDIVELNGQSYLHVRCGRPAMRLYGPQSVWTIQQAMGVKHGYEVAEPPPEDEKNAGDGSAGDQHLRLSGQWYPGLTDPIRASGPRSFACHHCWKVEYPNLTCSGGWNNLVTHITGGLLYGFEVERPADTWREKRRKPRPMPPAAQLHAEREEAHACAKPAAG